MAVIQERPKRKISGGRYRDYRKKKLRVVGRLPAHTRLGEKNTTSLRIRGGKNKTVQLSSDIVNVYDPVTKKYAKSKILTVVNSQANRHFVRRNIMTKSAIIKT